jgi:translation initiation factor 4E
MAELTSNVGSKEKKHAGWTEAVTTAAAATAATTTLKVHPISEPWIMYFHLQNTDDWTFQSYYAIPEVVSLEAGVLLQDEINFELIKRTIMFVMKKGIKPMWEDPANSKGGGFSFKVHNKLVETVWRKLFYRLLGNTLGTSSLISNQINGISLSPKKSFCIIKIWMKTCQHINPNVFNDIEYLDKSGCLFKKHGNDF